MENNDENKLILNGELFLSVRSSIRRKKSSAEIIAKIEEVLNEGADINACDYNDNNNTILHIAAQKDEKDVVMYLLQKGARLFCNKNGKTAIQFALQNNTSIGKEIAEILTNQAVYNTRMTEKSLNKRPNINQCRQESVISTVSDQVIKYSKRSGTSGVSGQFYETKLLSLVVHRALHDKDIEDFYVAANIRDIGDFDDVCFRYENVACFMQTKHREHIDKAKLTVASVRSTTGKLGLGIYYDSFLKIRQKYSPTSSDPMFQGKFEEIESYFILYTPLKESFERKLLGNKPISDKLHSIIFTGENYQSKHNKCTDIFQFDFEGRDLDFLTAYIKQENMKVLGKAFLDFILSDKKLEVMMTNDLIKIYHPALARKVVSITKKLEPLKNQKNSKSQSSSDTSCVSNIPNFIHMGRFCHDFFESDDINLVILRNTFYKEIVYTHSQKTNLSKDEVKQKINDIEKSPCAETISVLIGSPIKFDDTNDKLCLDITKLPKNKYKQDEIQQIRYSLQKIQVTRSMVRDAVNLAGKIKLQSLTFQLPPSFGNIDLTTNQKTMEGLKNRLDFLADKFNSLINYFAEKNKHKKEKIIEISSEVVGPSKILEYSHLSSNGGIGGTVGNLLKFDIESESFIFNTDNSLIGNARLVLDQLKTLTSEDLTNYKIKVLIDTFPRVTFDVYKYDKSNAAEFLRKLWFYTNQAQEESVEATLKEEINIYYNADKQRNQFLFHVHSDAIFLRFHDEIQKWWKRQGEAHYLTKSTTTFEKAKRDIVDSPLLTVLNVMFIRKIKKIGVEFNPKAIDCLNLNTEIDGVKNKLVNIVTNAVILSATKLTQYDNFKTNYTFINLDYIHILPQNDYETMIEEIKEIKDVTPIIVSEAKLSSSLQETLHKLLSIFTTQNVSLKKQVIVITIEPFHIDQKTEFQNYDTVIVNDNDINLINLSPKSQEILLEKCKVTYQGQEIRLNEVLNENSLDLVKGKLLWSLLNKEKIEIGHTLDTPKYNEIKNYYINRNLKYNGEEYPVGTLDDLDDKIVLISSKPCMGKSILLTHLSLETKKIDAKPWIVRINLSAHNRDFQNIKHQNIRNIMIFLCKAALKKSDMINKINFTEADKETIGFDTKDPELITFELELFIHLYNSGNIIFIFDGFDEIYPHYTNEAIELFTMLEQANKRMWITSNCYVVEILERRFGASYKLERLSTIQQKSFLERFWTTNIKLEKLNHEQFNNFTVFFNYILRTFNHEVRQTEDTSDRTFIPLLSVPLQILYYTLLDFFKNETYSLSPCYIREAIKKKWRLNSYTAMDRFLRHEEEKEMSLELAGTPLHMYIAANYFAFQITDKFDLHLNTKMISDRSNAYLNMVDLYERFLKVNIKKICESKNKTTEKDQDKIRTEFFDNHKKLALYAICKESDISKILTEPEIREVKETIKMIESGEIKSEFIDTVVDGIPRFYHILFAEYFCVEYLTDILYRIKNNEFNNLSLDSVWDFIVNIILLTSPPGLRNAFEYKLKYNPELMEVASNESSRKIMFDLLLKSTPSTNENTPDNALSIAINEKMVNITNFLLRGVRNKINNDNIDVLMSVLKTSANILETADTSRSILSENVLRCIQNVDGATIISVLNSNDAGKQIQENIKDLIMEPVKKLTAQVADISGNNENLVRLMERIPFHLTDFIRQMSKK